MDHVPRNAGTSCPLARQALPRSRSWTEDDPRLEVVHRVGIVDIGAYRRRNWLRDGLASSFLASRWIRARLFRPDLKPIAPIFNNFFFSSKRRHTMSLCDWSSDVCSSDLG